VLGFAFSLELSVPRRSHGTPLIAITYVLVCLFLATSYMLNNVADTTQDRAVAKRVGLDDWPLWARALPPAVTAVLGLGLGLAALPGAAAAALVGCYALAWVYSFPPRCKEHPFLGPIVAAFAQAPAPALALALAWGAWPATALVYLGVIFLYGVRMILVHQILDHDNDMRTATRTTATALGIPTMFRMLRALFAAELACTAVLLVLLAVASLPSLLLVALVWPAFLALLRLHRGERPRLDSYSWIPLADLHESLLPLLLAAAIAFRDGVAGFGAGLMLVVLFADRHLERLVRPLLRREYFDG
jgi:4-hydroxybenzoate polyprenyltransferase